MNSIELPPRSPVQSRVAGAIRDRGYTDVPGGEVRSAIGLAPRRLDGFAAHWNGLVTDPYVGDTQADKYRERRYARYHLVDDGTEKIDLVAQPNRTFVQDADHVSLYEGRGRSFAYATDAMLDDPVLGELIAFDYRCLPLRWPIIEVGLHFIRVRVDPRFHSRPTPEGRHRDGHDFVAMHLIDRHNCDGGESTIYRSGTDEVLLNTTMVNAFDTLIVDDASVEHEVSTVVQRGGPGHRDVLLVAFYPPLSVAGNPPPAQKDQS